MIPLVTHAQAGAYASPWSLRRRLALALWQLVWTLACAWTPKPANAWRLFVLRRFGARIRGRPFVHGRARIAQPWNLILHHRACLGEDVRAYSLGEIEIGPGATVAQEAYLCTGTHNFSSADLPLQTAAIRIGAGAFLGARSFILPGVQLGARCIVGAGAVVTRDVPADTVVAGNPARVIRRRPPDDADINPGDASAAPTAQVLQ
jgi:putative colanic acid biosynthesis acetyltransferase WcaF